MVEKQLGTLAPTPSPQQFRSRPKAKRVVILDGQDSKGNSSCAQLRLPTRSHLPKVVGLSSGISILAWADQICIAYPSDGSEVFYKDGETSKGKLIYTQQENAGAGRCRAPGSGYLTMSSPSGTAPAVAFTIHRRVLERKVET